MVVNDSNRLYYEIANRLQSYPHTAQVTKPFILALPLEDDP